MGTWHVSWRTLKALRLASRVLKDAASRSYFRRIEVALWPESRTAVLNLERVSRSPYASFVEELRFIQWPNAEDGDYGNPPKDPDLRAFSDENKEALTSACKKFTRLRELSMDETGYATTQTIALSKVYPFWSTVLDSCSTSLSSLSYHWPGTPEIFLNDRFYDSDDEDPPKAVVETGPWQNRWDAEQVKKLNLTVGQYCISIIEPFVKIPVSFGIRNLEELSVSYLWWLPTFWLPAQFLDITTLRGFALTMEYANYIDVPAQVLAQVLTQNKNNLQWIRLERLVLRGDTWAQVLGVLQDAPAMQDVNFAKLMVTVDRASRREVCLEAKTFDKRGWNDDSHEHSNDLKVIGAVLDNAERNARVLKRAK